MEQKRFVEAKDLELINATLAGGRDVRVQVTPYGCRIIADQVEVLRKNGLEESRKGQKKEG